jgi:hypothetical protein
MMNNSDNRTIFLTLIVVAMVLFTPVVVKWVINDNTYMSEDTYYNLRMVKQFDLNNAAHQDVLLQRPYDFNLFHYIFSKLHFGMDALANYLPPIFGIITLILVFFLLKTLNLGHNDIFFAMIILSTTPIFLYSFTTFSPELLVLPIFLIGLILFMRGNYASAVFFGLTAFFNIFYAVLGLILIVGDYIFKNKKKLLLIINSGVIALFVLMGIFVFKIDYLRSFTPMLSGLNGLLIEFGAIKGYALIVVGLSLLGLFSWWKKDSSKTAILIGVIVIFLSSVFFEDARLPIAIILAVFAAFSISYLTNREWEIFVLKGVTLLLILCILFFSAVLAINFQVKDITQKEVSSIAYLSSAGKSDIILSVERNGFITEYVADREAYLDSKSYKFEDYANRTSIANKIYYSRSLPELESLLKQEKITHILIDDKMRTGEVWTGRYEGLLFFLETSDKFIKVFYDDNIQIYRYVGDVVK